MISTPGRTHEPSLRAPKHGDGSVHAVIPLVSPQRQTGRHVQISADVSACRASEKTWTETIVLAFVQNQKLKRSKLGNWWRKDVASCLTLTSLSYLGY